MGSNGVETGSTGRLTASTWSHIVFSWNVDKRYLTKIITSLSVDGEVKWTAMENTAATFGTATPEFYFLLGSSAGSNYKGKMSDIYFAEGGY
mmetsp:Transcript_54929/g.83139  ORF Transcript_54929/g.83139 Transcript_54929/m.83139 type:complete len:92 (+) Transcript_54929:388-663(+)